jgi:tetratricopeptide (TPR) repeat protein
MEREIGRAPGEHVEDWMSHNRALVLARSGQMKKARTMWERAVALAQQTGNRERAAIYRAAEAVCEAHFGNAAPAKERARAALELAKGRDVEYAAASALALSGDSSGPQWLAADLEKRFPEDTPVQFEYLPTLGRSLCPRSSGAAGCNRAITADSSLRFRAAGYSILCQIRRPLSRVVCGQAYLEAHQGREAAAEFQKVLDHRGLVFADPIGALAHLQLGRAYVVSGDTAKAQKAYQDFLTLWKDADANIPVLKQAKAEYAKL